MSSILSDTDVPIYTFNAFHSFEGFDILDIELPQNFDQKDLDPNQELSPQNHQEIGENSASFEIIHSSSDYDPNNDQESPEDDSNQESSSEMLGKGKFMIEFFYSEEKEIIQLDSSIVTFDDYEIF